MSLIPLTRAISTGSIGPDSNEILVNTMRIMYVEDYEGHDEGECRIWLDNGRQIVVMESQDEIRDLELDIEEKKSKGER